MNDATPLHDQDWNAVLCQQRRGWERGAPELVEALMARHGALRGHHDVLLDLINHEIVLRAEFGTPANRDEYLERFPELQSDLMILFEVHEAIEVNRRPDASTINAVTAPIKAKPDWPTLPNYEVIDVLGEGGMGIVYKAIDQRLKRPVALKMIRTSRPSEDMRRRFQAEAEAVARLDHPGIVHIFEIGAYEGQPYLALEYLDGGSLAGDLRGTPQAPLAAARVIETLARSVHHAHGLGIIHRDLKPANILLQKVVESPSQSGESVHWIRDGNAYALKIADFGLAKHVQNDSDATQTHAIVGTPGYMAPEQASLPTSGSGTRGRIGPAADIFSLGAILYEMLTGRPPFRGDSMLETLDQVRTQDPIPPTRLEPKVPRDLETICLKCLAKDPAHRYASADALADDLARFLRHEPIHARPASIAQKTILWIRRRPALAALYATVCATVLLVAFVGFPYVTYLWRQTLAEKEHSQAQLYGERINKAHEYWLKTKCEHMHTLLQSMKPKAGERDRRDFEWHYLWGLLHQDLARVPADGGLACSRDGKLLAAGVKNEIHIWKTADLENPAPRPIAKLTGHAGELVSIAFHPDGDRVLSSAKDRTVRLWDFARQTAILTLPPHPEDVTDVAFHPIDGSFATASSDGIIRLWEPDGAKRLELDEHTASVNDIAFSADGKSLVSASADKSVIVWDVATGDVIHKLKGHAGIVFGVAIHGRQIASAGMDGHIRLWDSETGGLIHTYPKMPHAVKRLAFRGDGKRLAAACFDQSIHLWDTDSAGKKFAEEAALVLRGHVGLIDGLAFSPSGDRLASMSRDHTMRLWDSNRGQDSQVYALPAMGNRLALCPNRPLVAVAGKDKNVHLCNWRTGALSILPGHAAEVQAVAFTADGTLGSAASDGTIRIWDIGKEKLVREFTGSGKPISAFAFHPGGHRLVTAGADGVVQFWEAAGGTKLYQGPAHRGTIHGLAFNSDGRWLASAGADGMVFLCDSETGHEVRRFRDADLTPSSLAFSPDGHYLAAGDAQKTIRIWDLHTGKRIFRLEGHDSPVHGLAFSHSGKRLASAGGVPDGAVKLWDLTTGLELLTLRGHGREITGVVFTPHDEALISLGRTANMQAQLRVWEAYREAR